jgi:hypothetical protein
MKNESSFNDGIGKKIDSSSLLENEKLSGEISIIQNNNKLKF